MRTSEAGIELIAQSEAFRSKPYLCPARIATIGYGTTIYPNKIKVKLTDKPISEATARGYLRHMVDTVYEEVIDRLVKVPLNQGQYDALVDFVYNVGEVTFRKSSILTYLNQKKYDIAFDRLDLYNKGGGKVLKGLQIRRDKEQLLAKSNNKPLKEE